MPIAIENRQKMIRLDTRRIRRSLKKVMKALNCEDGELSLLLVDNDQIREFNRTYLKRDRSTNVISFSMREGEFGAVNPRLLGDIILSVETVARDAIAGGLDPLDEVEFLLIHGLLHLIGYEHENTTPEEARKMKIREQELFFQLRGYPII